MPVMNFKRIFLATAAATLSLGSTGAALAQSGELTLYGVALKDAKVAQFVAAAKAAGAKASGSAPASLGFNVTATGVPALKTLSVLSARGELVAAQFTVVEHGAENETLRKMLEAKYGAPEADSKWPGVPPSFAGKFISNGTYTWQFAGEMTLTFKKTHMNGTTLTYADSGKLKTLTREAEAASSKAAGTKAEKLGNNF